MLRKLGLKQKNGFLIKKCVSARLKVVVLTPKSVVNVR